jgi:hypothetical protein
MTAGFDGCIDCVIDSYCTAGLCFPWCWLQFVVGAYVCDLHTALWILHCSPSHTFEVSQCKYYRQNAIRPSTLVQQRSTVHSAQQLMARWLCVTTLRKVVEAVTSSID